MIYYDYLNDYYEVIATTRPHCSSHGLDVKSVDPKNNKSVFLRKNKERNVKNVE